MIRLEETIKYRVDTEEEAKLTMERLREDAHEHGYTISKCGYTKKEKKSKGEIVDEGYLLSCTKVYNSFWGI